MTEQPRGRGRFEAKPSLRSQEQRNALAVQWLDLVPWAIYEMRPRLRGLARLIGHRDAIQVGNMALLRAAELWDDSKGKFSTYAVVCVRKRVIRAARAVEAKRPQWNEWTKEYESGIACSELTEVERIDLREAIDRATSCLTYRQREIIRLRYGLGDEIPYTLDEVGRVFGITRERVRQIEIRAIHKLSSRSCKLAQSFGLQPCKKCHGWVEWETVCRVCSVTGCLACVRRRQLPEPWRNMQLCTDCTKTIRSDLKKKSPIKTWSDYGPLSLGAIHKAC